MTITNEASDLVNIGELIRTQDNRCTSDPIFIVQQKRRIWGMDEDSSDDYVWMENEYWEEVDIAKDAELKEKDSNFESTEGYTKLFYLDVWDFVTACFTEQGCKDYIAVNGHNLTKPRIYAASAYRNEEWIAVREFLKGQDKP